PNGIGWSAIGSPTDMYVGAQPNSAMFELVPGKSQVFFVVPGAESSEFVFCDNKLYYIPISVTNPLKPGSVAFQEISSDGCANVKPKGLQEVIIYANAGQTSIKSIIAPGAYYRPFETRDLSESHQRMFNNIQAIAAPTADGTFNERYMYVLNGDGTIAVGKYSVKSGQIEGIVGWVPWSGGGTMKWVSAFAASVLFCGSYAPNGISPVTVTERLDDTLYLDAAQFVNSPPAPLAPPMGKGPLWWMPGGTVELMDQSTRPMGTYQIDANGFIVPQFNGGEDLTSPSLVAGQKWTMTIEPFVPGANPGLDQNQRRHKRQIAGTTVYVYASSGFVEQSLRDGQPKTERRIPAWNAGEDPALPPPLREMAYEKSPTGSAHDPRELVYKDTPGPFTLLEYTIEVSV